MLKIATHNSATGERGKGLLSFLVAIFSKCQSKTIKELYNVGCRYFDIRIKDIKGIWYCKHGLWTSKKTAFLIIKELSMFPETVYITITYCGKGHENETLLFADEVESAYKNIKVVTVNIKKPKWKCIDYRHKIPCKGEFKNLDGSTWHTYLPLPWLWKIIYHNKPTFNEEYFKMVDFL